MIIWFRGLTRRSAAPKAPNDNTPEALDLPCFSRTVTVHKFAVAMLYNISPHSLIPKMLSRNWYGQSAADSQQTDSMNEAGGEWGIQHPLRRGPGIMTLAEQGISHDNATNKERPRALFPGSGATAEGQFEPGATRLHCDVPDTVRREALSYFAYPRRPGLSF